MKASNQVGAIVTLLLIATGCSSNPNSRTPEAGRETQSPQKAASAIAPVSAKSATQPVSTKSSLVPIAVRSAQAVLTPGLIQPTNPDKRLAGVMKGRRDPFSIVPIPVAVTIRKNPVPAKPLAALPPAPAVMNLPPVLVAQNPPMPGTQLPGGVASAPLAVAPAPVAPIAPVAPAKPPSPTAIAQGVEVTGVLQAQGKLSAIVKAPDEVSSRTVQAGDYLSNGKVLVKRIEVKPNREPIVILEQNGIEVIRSVGSPVASAL